MEQKFKYDEKYISDILDYVSDKTNVVLDTKGGGLRAHGLTGDAHEKRTIALIGKIYKANKPLFLSVLNSHKNPPIAPPVTLASKVSDAASAVRSFLPSTGAGLGSVGALTAATLATGGADIPLMPLLALGMGGGAAGAALTGENQQTGAMEGLANAGMEAGIGGAVKGAKMLGKWWMRPTKLNREMMAGIGDVVGNGLGKYLPNSVSNVIRDVADFSQKGKDTVVRMLNGKQASAEMSRFQNDTYSTIVSKVEKEAQNHADQMRQAFQKQFGWLPKEGGVRPAGMSKMAPAERKAVKVILDNDKRAKTIAKDMRNAFSEIHGQGRTLYDPSGGLKHTYSAWNLKTNTLPELEQFVNDEIGMADQSGALTQQYQEAQDAYSKFKGFQDFVNTKNALSPDNAWFQADTLQKTIDPQTNPAITKVANRLKDSFEPLVKTVKRNAPAMQAGKAVVADRPPNPLLARLRGTEALPGMPRLYNYIPLPNRVMTPFTRFIGDESVRIPSQSAGKLPSRLLPPLSKVTEGPQLPPPQIPEEYENASKP